LGSTTAIFKGVLLPARSLAPGAGRINAGRGVGPSAGFRRATDSPILGPTAPTSRRTPMPRLTLSRRAVIEALAAALPASAAALLGLRAAAAGNVVIDAPMTVRRCPTNECGYLYDPALGDPEAGVPPGVAFANLPETWRCPVCARIKGRW
jgi:rubredoxin